MNFDDRDLRQVFEVLRREEAVATPPLRAVLDRARPWPQARRPLRRWVPAMGVATAGVLLAVAILRPGNGESSLVSLDAARWQSPTDFLLRVPGAEYFASVPSLGGRQSILVDSLR